MRNKLKKGLSPIIASVLIVLLVFVVTAIVWTTYKNLVERNLNRAGTCLETLGKIEIKGRYTCYDSNVSHPQFQFSIERKNIEVEEIIVSLMSPGGSTTFTLSNTSLAIPGLRAYPNSNQTKMPNKNSAITYIVNLTHISFSGVPEEIKVIPVASGEQCEPTDSLNEIDTCFIGWPSSPPNDEDEL